MVQIALISDIHANLPALEVVLKDIESRGIQERYCLGDLVDFAPWGNAVIDRLQQENIPCILGNHDERIGRNLPIIPLQKHNATETAARIQAINYSKDTISEAHKTYLANLPFERRLQYTVGKRVWTIVLVHATVESNDAYLYPTEGDAVFEKQLNMADADVLAIGHTHLSFVKQIGHRWVVNGGSVGRSREDNRLASYVILHLHEQRIDAHIVQLDYPIAEVADAIRASPIPDFYADFLIQK
ncbi:metallophosphoesterase family protein [Sphingobacterium sp. Mn56C]|uniref:metallophosphoesterase family protein n=1 Tax=Sphingobacterium sp. Mn56C TaxID=3395261 RepID=UPI003BE7BF1E